MINATPAAALDKLKSEYGLYSYFRDGILHVGFANDASVTNEAEFKMEEVVINSDTLEWQRAEDVRLKVVAISMFPDNTKSDPIEFGDADGNQITIHKYNMDAKSLEFAAKEWIAENKYTGFKGEIETFGEPIMKHGDRVKLTSTKLPERDGTYLIKKVKRIYGVNDGNHQLLTLGIKVA
jgi:phage protein D